MISLKHRNLTGKIIADTDQLKKQCLDMLFTPNELVLVKEDPDARFFQISKKGILWYSIYRQQIHIHE